MSVRSIRRVSTATAVVAIVAVLLVGAPPAHAAPGDLDPSFGNDGIVTTAIGPSSDVANALAVQSDGKVVAAGSSFNGANNDFALARYSGGDLLDVSFGSGGKLTTAMGTGSDSAEAVAVQPDGKIVAAGYSVGSTYDFALARYTTAGALDTTFGTGGKVITPVGGSDDLARAVAIQQLDGKIVVAGFADNGSNHDFAVVRYTSSGALDASFGSGGKAIIPMGSGTDEARAVAIQPDGKIVVAGTSSGASSIDFAVVRLTSSGSSDPTFGASGKVTTDFAGSSDLAYAMGVQPNGRIVVAGSSFDGSNQGFALARYTSFGVLDDTFGTLGRVTTVVGSGGAAAHAMGIQADGRIVAAGYSSSSLFNSDFAVARYTASGALDGAFGAGGKVITPIGAGTEVINAIGFLTNGLIVAAGYSSVEGNNDFALAGYLANPPSISIGDASLVEGDGEPLYMDFPVSLAGAGASDYVTVDYQTVADTAGSKDFGATSGTLTFNPEQTTGTISVPVKSDSIHEEVETLFVKLSSPAGATLGDFIGEGTIVDNDGFPDLSIVGSSVTEGNSSTTRMVFTLGLSNPSSDYIFVDYATANGTATAGSDYVAKSGTKVIKPGQSTARVTIQIIGDTTQEANETVFVDLVDADGASLDDPHGIGIILDDDRPTISINDAQVTEGTSGTTKTMTFTVTLSKAGTSSITVQYATANGTAVAPGDYTAKSGTLTFTAGQVSKPITVTIKGDNLAECTESFFVNLSNPTNATIADGQGVGTIITDDPAPCDG